MLAFRWEDVVRIPTSLRAARRSNFREPYTSPTAPAASGGPGRSTYTAERAKGGEAPQAPRVSEMCCSSSAGSSRRGREHVGGGSPGSSRRSGPRPLHDRAAEREELDPRSRRGGHPRLPGTRRGICRTGPHQASPSSSAVGRDRTPRRSPTAAQGRSRSPPARASDAARRADPASRRPSRRDRRRRTRTTRTDRAHPVRR